jgi:hypothetical protein
MLTILNRMCWNTRNWRLPTNTSGDGGYSREMGFGHEEWNFQVEDAVDGFVYGYLYYRPARKTVVEAGGHFRIGFWIIHPDTRERLLVGTYDVATLPTEEDYIGVDDAFSRRGVYERRAQELSSAVSSISFEEAYNQVTGAVREHWLSFKCPVEGVHHLAEYVPVREIVKSRTLGMYFTRPTFIPSSELPSVPRCSAPASKGELDLPRSSALVEDAYYRESPQYLRLIIRRHNKLSNEFAAWLRESGYSKVVQEQNYVDVAFDKDGELYRAELKTCYGVSSTRAIREGLGQLLEYNYYPGRNSADRWVIILDEQATTDDISYVYKLRQGLNLPLCLGWRKGEGFVFATGLGL